MACLSLDLEERGWSFARIARIALLVVVSMFHAVLIILLSLCLEAGSGGVYEAMIMATNWLGLIVAAGCVCHKVVRSGKEHRRRRATVTLMTLFAVSLITFAMVLVRAQGGILYQDFSAMPDGKTVANIVIVLSCFAMLLGMLGFAFAFVEHVEVEPEVKSAPKSAPKPPPQVTFSPEPRRSPKRPKRPRTMTFSIDFANLTIKPRMDECPPMPLRENMGKSKEDEEWSTITL